MRAGACRLQWLFLKPLNALICYRFFTMVPHDFGSNNAPLLSSIEMIKGKTAMLDNLLEIEIAYSLLKSGKLIFLVLHLVSLL